MDKVIELTEDMFIGKGTQKAVYAYPGDASKCIKVKIIAKNADMLKELAYRKVLQRTGKHKKMLPEYYGCVKTNLGDGYVFELVRDFDGQRSREIEEYLKEPELAEKLLHTDVLSILQEFKKEFLQEMIVTSNIEPYNMLVQRLSEETYKICVVDNVGTPCKIPLAYWFDYFAKKRAERYWKKFVQETGERFPQYQWDKLV